MPCIGAGYGLWTIGTGLKCIFTKSTPLWALIVVLLVEGLGIGLTLQPSKFTLGIVQRLDMLT